MDGGVVFMPGVPGFPPGASWSRDETDSLVHASPEDGSQTVFGRCERALSSWPPAWMAGHREPAAAGQGNRGTMPRVSVRHARGAAFGRCVSTRPSGLALDQKAPGGSRGTPGHSPPRSPCAAGLHRGITCRSTAWMAGWFSCPESPGFHPGLLGAVTKPIPWYMRRQKTVRKRPSAAACRQTLPALRVGRARAVRGESSRGRDRSDR
jgi:hypothetical protein